MTFGLLSACALLSYGFLAKRSQKWISTEKHTLWLNRLFGSMFIALGVGLLQLQHKNQSTKAST